ncbi:hypothetical protein AEYBE204_10125 [Asticcacaulis sp. YBE204]|nr:hypothetical protein AEYBE204_10125 [Asticcacaulis sp. YBE204]
MIYGASGYTGRMAAHYAKAAGTPLVLAGRSKETLAALAADLDVEYRVFGLDTPVAIDERFADVSVLLNCAGPFLRRSETVCTISTRLPNSTAIAWPKSSTTRRRLGEPC